MKILFLICIVLAAGYGWSQERRACNCGDFDHYDLNFDLVMETAQTLDDTILKWTSHPDRLRIKSIMLKNIDSIPASLLLFENVESIWINEAWSKDFSLLSEVQAFEICQH